jgi:hypothetical protein
MLMSRTEFSIICNSIAGLLFFMSCSTSKIVIDIPEPSAIDIPEEIKKLTLYKYRLFDNSVDEADVIKEMISGEGGFVEKVATDNVINGFREKIGEYDRFTIAGFEERLVSWRPVSSFPAPIPWQEVNEICRKYSSDALVSLETFNTSISVDLSYYAKQKGRGKAEQIYEVAYDISEKVIHVGQISTKVETGWRIYYPARSKILFMEIIRDSTLMKVEAESKEEAERKLHGKQMAVENASYMAGNRFAQLLNPGYSTVERKYYSKGNDDFRMARTFVLQRYWNKAAEMWEQNLENPDTKIASAANFNMAMINEMKGEIEYALEFAKSALQLNRKKTIESYIKLLENRISKRERQD